MSLEFVSQKKISTAIPRNLSRIQYLLNGEQGAYLKKEIVNYFSNHPEGDKVTLEVFKALGQAGLQRLAKENGSKLARIKQDIGMAVPIIGEWEYPGKFQTCRNTRTGKSSQRKTTKEEKQIAHVQSYTPHRIQEIPAIESIFGTVSSATDGVQYQNELRADHERHEVYY